MKSLIQLVLILTFLLTSVDIYPQLSTGRAPFRKAQSHAIYGTFHTADIAYANDNSTSSNISMPVPAGHPFNVIGSFSAPNFASSMIKGGDGNYYLIDVAPALYLFNPNTGSCALIGNITGMNGEQANGISYNPLDETYYLISASALYSFDINNLEATLIDPFNPAISGFMIDFCFDEHGICYSYEVNTTPGAANAYIIDIGSAALTSLGYLGFTPNYGQGMSYDMETHTIYLSAFNYDTFSGQLRTMDKTTGMTTLVYDWGDQIAPFAVNTSYGPPCPVAAASNPYPPDGATGISLNGTTLTWDNGAGATAVEIWFGPTGNIVKVYDGAPVTSYDTGLLQYNMNYRWNIKCKNDSCYTSGPTWSFVSEHDPFEFYPQFAQYWTGSTDGSTKTDGEINTIYPNVGWAVYDISSISPGSTVVEVNFNGYVNNNDWPYWSATPMGTVNPVTDDAAAINAQIQAGYDQGTAYIYENENSTLEPGWYTYPMGNDAIPDVQAAVNSGQGWFAMGFVDRDFSPTYYINFDGWSQPNPPFLQIGYSPVPVDLTSFRADVNDGKVVLSWATATETNNKGFEVEKQVSSKQKSVSRQWEEIGFVAGYGTTTEPKSYSFTDNDLKNGTYSYRLKQIDFDGSYKYSNVIEVTVNQPDKYSLEQNYPNPFNPTTMIEYSIASDGYVTLNVYNVLGQKVDELVNGEVKAGTYEVNFDASNLSSGVYYYRIEANGFVSTRKMVLLR